MNLAKFEMRYKSILELQADNPHSIQVKYQHIFVSRTFGITIDIENIAKAVMGATGIPYAELLSVLTGLLCGNEAGFVLRNNSNEVFQANNTDPTYVETPGPMYGWVMRSYYALFLSSSQWGADILGFARAGDGKKLMGVKSIVVCCDTKSVIFPEVAKEDDSHSLVLEAYNDWLAEVTKKLRGSRK
jgi:hypothetical protein